MGPNPPSNLLKSKKKLHFINVVLSIPSIRVLSRKLCLGDGSVGGSFHFFIYILTYKEKNEYFCIIESSEHEIILN